MYDHGKLDEGDTLQILAERLLKTLCQLRKTGHCSQDSHSSSRPIFFMSHSTGGLVAKKALVLANEKEQFTTIANDSYGVTFIATPHQGSAYLSSKEFRPSIREVMRLLSDIPDSLQRQFGFKCDELNDMAEKFKQSSTDLRINTYYETSDSDLAFTPANDHIPRSYHVPIASAASAIMDLEHESETPLSSDHVGCATFEGDNEAQATFISELKDAVRSAAELSKIKDCSIDLENEVQIEVNGFFDDSTSSVKLWTARPSLADFLKDGPKELLKARLSQSKETIKHPSGRKDLPEINKQENPASTLTVEEPKIKIQDKLQNKIKSNKVLDKLLQLRDPLVRSASDTSTTKGFNHQPSNEPQLRTDEVAQSNAPIAAPVNSSTTSVRFSQQTKPSEERRAAIDPADPGPQLPAMDQLKLTWVHIPYTHPGWVPLVLDQFSKERRLDARSDFLKEEHWASNHNHGRHAAPHAKYVKSSFVDPSKAIRAQPPRSSDRFAVYVSVCSSRMKA